MSFILFFIADWFIKFLPRAFVVTNQEQAHALFRPITIKTKTIFGRLVRVARFCFEF